MNNPELKRAQLDELGYLKIASDELGVDVRKLSKELLDFVIESNFKNLPPASSASNIKEYLDIIQ
jgi:hypothetical protein